MTDDAIIRLALVEARLERLIEDLENRDKKLDELLELKHKGLGALWLATLILGTSIVAGVTTVVSWIKG